MQRMSDEMWRRHANPWSVWTRFAAIPAFILAAWSRVWLGWWSLIPIGLVVAWLFLNVIVFFAGLVPQQLGLQRDLWRETLAE